MKTCKRGSWGRGKKGLLEHMASVAKCPQPLQNIHLLEMQWMSVANPWVLDYVGGSSVRNTLHKINKFLGRFVLSDPLILLSFLAGNNLSHICLLGAFLHISGSKDLAKVFPWGPTFACSSSPGMATPKSKEGSPKVTSPGNALMYLHLISGQYC